MNWKQFPLAAKLTIKHIAPPIIIYAFSLLLWILIFFWATFLGYSLTKLFQGGSSALLAWYGHIANPGLTTVRWEVGSFFLHQAILLAITFALWFARRLLIHQQGQTK